MSLSPNTRDWAINTEQKFIFSHFGVEKTTSKVTAGLLLNQSLICFGNSALNTFYLLERSAVCSHMTEGGRVKRFPPSSPYKRGPKSIHEGMKGHDLILP